MNVWTPGLGARCRQLSLAWDKEIRGEFHWYTWSFFLFPWLYFYEKKTPLGWKRRARFGAKLMVLLV